MGRPSAPNTGPTPLSRERQRRAAFLRDDDSAEPFITVPYIWSDQYDVKIQVLGDPGPDDVVEVVNGSIEAGRFVAVYGRSGRLAAAVGFGRPRQLMGFRPLLSEGATFDQGLAHLEG